MGVVALVAEQAHGAGLLHQRRELVHLFARLRRFQVFCVDFLQHIVLPAAGGEAALFRRAERGEMDVGDAALVEPCRRLLGDAAKDVRAMAVWALGRLDRLDNVRRILSEETEGSVLAKLDRAERDL